MDGDRRRSERSCTVELTELQELARRVVDDPTLTYRQRIQSLAGVAEEALTPPSVSDECAAALDKRVICDLHEGNAPYRPRYTLAGLRTRDGTRQRVPRTPAASGARRGAHVPAVPVRQRAVDHRLPGVARRRRPAAPAVHRRRERRRNCTGDCGSTGSRSIASSRTRSRTPTSARPTIASPGPSSRCTVSCCRSCRT